MACAHVTAPRCHERIGPPLGAAEHRRAPPPLSRRRRDCRELSDRLGPARLSAEWVTPQRRRRRQGRMGKPLHRRGPRHGPPRRTHRPRPAGGDDPRRRLAESRGAAGPGIPRRARRRAVGRAGRGPQLLLRHRHGGMPADRHTAAHRRTGGAAETPCTRTWSGARKRGPKRSTRRGGATARNAPTATQGTPMPPSPDPPAAEPAGRRPEQTAGGAENGAAPDGGIHPATRQIRTDRASASLITAAAASSTTRSAPATAQAAITPFSAGSVGRRSGRRLDIRSRPRFLRLHPRLAPELAQIRFSFLGPTQNVRMETW